MSVFQVDVSGAYESLPHAKLLDVIREVLSPVQDEAFTIRRYAKIWPEAFKGGLMKSFVNWVRAHKFVLLLYTIGIVLVTDTNQSPMQVSCKLMSHK